MHVPRSAVLILGGAEGLGAAFARALAPRSRLIWLVDHQPVPLERFAASLRADHEGLSVRTLELDLAQEEAVSAITVLMEGEGIDLMVYVAAFSSISRFDALSEVERRRTLRLNVTQLVALAHAFGNSSSPTRGRRGLVLVSSLAGLWGLPGLSLYGATKAFTWNFAESIHAEWKERGIDVLALICGPMPTPGMLRSGPRLEGLLLEDADRTVREGLRQLGRRPTWIAGWKTRWAAFLLGRVLPRSWSLAVMRRSLRRMYPDRL